jgi:hypothetical protein
LGSVDDHLGSGLREIRQIRSEGDRPEQKKQSTEQQELGEPAEQIESSRTTMKKEEWRLLGCYAVWPL